MMIIDKNCYIQRKITKIAKYLIKNKAWIL